MLLYYRCTGNEPTDIADSHIRAMDAAIVSKNRLAVASEFAVRQQVVTRFTVIADTQWDNHPMNVWLEAGVL